MKLIRRLDHFMRSLCCALLGHCWNDVPLQYRQSTAYARIGREKRLTLVPVMWVTDEVCSWCGTESSWPA